MLKTIQKKLRIRGWSFVPAAALFCLALTATSCLTNNLNVNNGILTSVDATSAINGIDSEGGALTLSRVVKSSSDPSTYLDLIGRSDGEIGQYCSGDSTTGESTCTCNYTFTNDAGDEESIDVPTVYREANLIRCAYTELKKKGLPTTKISIHVSDSSDTYAYSNAITYYFTGTGTTQDYTNPSTFAPVVRYQCQDVIFIPHLLDGNIYDPFLSSDPEYTYSFNYYTTNMGGTLERYATEVLSNEKGTGWNCPATPIDTSLNQQATHPDEFDLRIFSQGSLDTKLIYPVAGSIDRHNFSLAKTQSTIFNVPVNSYMFPGTPSVIGYAAASISLGDDQEACPDVSKPDGYDWVKLWQFRGSMESRKRPVSTAIQNIEGIACNPGRWDADASPIYSSCTDAADDLKFSQRVFDLNRTKACVDRSTSAVSGYPVRPDLWADIDPSILGNDYLNLRTSTIPVDFAPVLQNIDNEYSQSDIILTVSPTDVHYKDINEGTEQGKPYIPYRFYSYSKCPDNDPDNPADAADCQVGNKITYYMEAKDITQTVEDPEDPARTRRFPLCVLQKVP